MRSVALVVLMACSGEDAPPADVPTGPLSGCDPLDPALCALPFPSSHFLVEDASTPTGLRLNFGPTTLPSNRDGV